MFYHIDTYGVLAPRRTKARKDWDDYIERPDKYTGPDHSTFLLHFNMQVGTINKCFKDVHNLAAYKYQNPDCVPELLPGNDFTFKRCIGENRFSKMIVAQRISDYRMCQIKIPKDFCDEEYTKKLLMEYVLQYQAYHTLIHCRGGYERYCMVPEPLGLIKIVIPPTPTADGQRYYCLVQEFVFVDPEEIEILTLRQAMVDHNKYNFFTLKEWRDIFIRLIQGVEILQKCDIYHMNLTADNILLRFHGGSTCNPEPFITNFLAGRRREDPDKPPGPIADKSLKGTPGTRHIAPENFELHEPLPTSDLYGISWMIMEVCKTLGNLPTLLTYIDRFRRQPCHQRQGFKSFKERVRLAFDKDIAIAGGAPDSPERIAAYSRPASPDPLSAAVAGLSVGSSGPSGAAAKPPGFTAAKPPSGVHGRPSDVHGGPRDVYGRPSVEHGRPGSSSHSHSRHSSCPGLPSRDYFEYIHRYKRHEPGHKLMSGPTLPREHMKMLFEKDIARPLPSSSSTHAPSIRPRAESGAVESAAKRTRLEDGESSRPRSGSDRSSGASGRSSGASGRSSGASGRSSGASHRHCPKCTRRFNDAFLAPSKTSAAPGGASAKYCRTCAAIRAVPSGPTCSSARRRSTSDRLDDAFIVPHGASGRSSGASGRSSGASGRSSGASDRHGDASKSR